MHNLGGDDIFVFDQHLEGVGQSRHLRDRIPSERWG